jgi:hypothetical protein
MPALCWDHLLASDDDVPVLAAWKYRVEVSKDSSFGTILETAETEQNCWTSNRGYEDGSYYWRVAMIDGQGRIGDFSQSAIFTKQYPTTTLVSPIGQSVGSTPTFVWTPVDGAAFYKLEISLNDTFAPVFESITTNNTRYTPTNQYDTGVRFYWRVAIVDKEGKSGPFTGATIIVGPVDYSEKVYLPLITR